MFTKARGPLNPEVKDIKIQAGTRYDQCRAKVTFDVSNGNGGREDLTIEYPIQGDRHLIMLMEKRSDEESCMPSKAGMSHVDVQELASVLKDTLDKGD